jgi:DNA polymerase-1
MKKLIIIDGNALLHRAYHAIAPLTDPKGRVVNAVYGFARVFIKAMKDLSPDYVAVAWDRREPTFRHEAYKEYKAQREKKPQELYDQITMIQDMMSAYGVPSYDAKGFEADDIIATIADKFVADKVIVLTGDKDTFQIVDEKINVLTFKKGVSETRLFTPEEIKKEYGLLPEQMVDLKALAGDPSDNIKGVHGIGKVGAEKLLKQYKNIDGIYKNLGKLDASEKIKAVLRTGKEDAYKSRDLVVLRKDAPVEFSAEEMKFGDYDREGVNNFFVEYGFRSLIEEQESRIKNQESGGQREIKDLSGVKKFLSRIKNELYFYIIEAQESLFGKEIREIQLAWGGESVKIIFGKNLPAKDFFKEIKPIFENEKIEKISHDIKNQMHILDRFGASVCGKIFDVMIAAYVLNPGTRGYDLECLVMDYLKKSLSDKLVFEIVNLKNLFEKKIEEEKLGRVFFEIEMPLVPVLFGMEKNGIKVDKKKLAGLSSDFESRLKKIDAEIWKLAGQEFNIDSPQQLKVVLYDKLALKPESGRIKKGKTGLSTAASELEKLAGLHPIIDLISEHRELAKLKNTYIDTLPKMLDKDARVHSSFNQTVTSTGRLSSSEPNLQNIPIRTELGKKIRESFIAEQGCVLISLDYSQIELRLAAALSGERHMIEAFAKGADIHKQTAAEIFGMPEKDVTKEMRSAAKSINFGILYGMGVAGLASATKMSRMEAEGFIARYYATHPAIMEYVGRTKALAYKTGYVETLFGRRRYLPEIQSHIPQLQAAAERMAINMPVQGTAADIIKLAMIEIGKNISSKDVKMVLQVHDELVFEVKKEKADNVAKEIKEVMENIYKLSVPLTVETEIGERWE